MEQAIRIFVGCDPNSCDLEQMMVLEYSLRKHASLPVDIHWMRLSRDPGSPWHSGPGRAEGWRTETWSTPFSALRWSVPACCGYQGRAIYMDADMLALDDIARVWTARLPDGAIVAARPDGDEWHTCVMLWDCARARGHVPALDELRRDPRAQRRMRRVLAQTPGLATPLASRYNCIDGEDLDVDEIGILHYSDMGTQFSHRYALPRLQREGARHWFDGQVLPHPRADLAALFDDYYHEAIRAGYTLDRYRPQRPFGHFEKETQKRYAGNRKPVARPSLLARLRAGLARALQPGPARTGARGKPMMKIRPNK